MKLIEYEEDGYDGWDNEIDEEAAEDGEDVLTEDADKSKSKNDKKKKKKKRKDDEDQEEDFIVSNLKSSIQLKIFYSLLFLYKMDCDVIDEINEKKKEKKKLSKFKEAVLKEKPLFDPSNELY